MMVFMHSVRPAFLALVLCVAGADLHAGIRFELRSEQRGQTFSTSVVADGQSYRTEAKLTAESGELLRQYPIEISTDAGKTRKRLRPFNQTWYQPTKERLDGTMPFGKDPQVRQPKVSLTEEAENSVIAGLPTRKLVLKASCVIESDAGTEKLKLHKHRTVLLWVAEMACAPPALKGLHVVRFGIPELDEPMERELRSIEGFIVRQVDSMSEHYEGGRPRAFLTTTEVVDPKCVTVDAALFSIPKGYQYQEPVMTVPGRM